MTLFEKIDLACRKGLYPIIELNGEYCIVSPDKDFNGDYRHTGFSLSIEEAKEYIGSWHDYTKKGWNEKEQQGAKLIDYYHRPVEPYKVGDLVDILEIAKSCGDYDGWDDEAKEMVGGKGFEIRGVWSNSIGLYYWVLDKDKKDYWTFRHEWLAPHFEETLPMTHEAMIAELRRAGKIKDGQIIV